MLLRITSLVLICLLASCSTNPIKVTPVEKTAIKQEVVASAPVPQSLSADDEGCTNIIDGQPYCFDGADLNRRTNFVYQTWARISYGLRSDGKTNRILAVTTFTNDNLSVSSKWAPYLTTSDVHPVSTNGQMLLLEIVIPFPWADRMFFRSQIWTNI